MSKMLQPKVKIGQILDRKKREDPIGLLNAQRNGTMAEYLADDLRAAGINPASVEFGASPSRTTPGNSLTSSPAQREKKADDIPSVKSSDEGLKRYSSEPVNGKISSGIAGASSTPATIGKTIKPVAEKYVPPPEPTESAAEELQKSTSHVNVKAALKSFKPAAKQETDYSYDFQGDKKKSSVAADKFSKLGAAAGGTNKCPLCTKTVYKAEELFAVNSYWHPACFTCGGTNDNGCKRRLTKQDFQINSGYPYCATCFDRIVKEQLAKNTGQLNTTLTTTNNDRDDSLKPAKINFDEEANNGSSSKADIITNSVVDDFKAEIEATVPKGSLAERSAAFKSLQRSDSADNNNSSFYEKSKSSGNAEKFSKLGAAAGGTNKCPSCIKTVYKAEELFAVNSFWHPACFTCGGVNDNGCKRRLTKQAFQVNNGHPYCATCFDRLVKEQLAKNTGSLNMNEATLAASSTIDGSSKGSATGSSKSIVADNEVVTSASSKAVAEQEELPKGIFAARAAAFKSAALSNSASTSNLFAEKSTTSSSNADKFSKLGAAAGGTNKCPLCVKTVYKAEELFAVNSFWHPACFTCGGVNDNGCKRRLTKQDFQVNNGHPYCATCFDRIVKEQLQRATVNPTNTVYNTNSDNTSGPSSPSYPKNGPSESSTSVATAVSATNTTTATVANIEPVVEISPRSAPIPKCIICKTNVYKLEEVTHNMNILHKHCFICGVGSSDIKGCERLLNIDTCVTYNGIPYCPSCALTLPTTTTTTENSVTVTATTSTETDIPTNTVDTKKGQEEESQISPNPIQSTEKPSSTITTTTTTTTTTAESNHVTTPSPVVTNAVTSTEHSTSSTKKVVETATKVEPVVIVAATMNQEIAPVASVASVKPEESSGKVPEAINEETTNGNELDVAELEENEKIVIDFIPEEIIDLSQEHEEIGEQVELEEGAVEFTDVEFQGHIYRGYHLSYIYNMDDNGVIYWIGSHHKTQAFENPHSTELVTASMSSLYKGQVTSIVGRTIETAPTYTENALNSWIKIDFGPDRLLLADNYTILHGATSKGNSLRNWVLQAKAYDDGYDDNWITLREHDNDSSLSDEPNSSATWALDIPDEISDSSTIGFRYFRIVQDGPNSNGNNCLFCCGLEFYGVLFEKLKE